jgi:hypothetical protein
MVPILEKGEIEAKTKLFALGLEPEFDLNQNTSRSKLCTASGRELA